MTPRQPRRLKVKSGISLKFDFKKIGKPILSFQENILYFVTLLACNFRQSLFSNVIRIIITFPEQSYKLQTSILCNFSKLSKKIDLQRVFASLFKKKKAFKENFLEKINISRKRYGHVFRILMSFQ